MGERRIIAILEPRSNTMRMGVHATRLPASLESADQVLVYSPGDMNWDAGTIFKTMGDKARVFDSVADIVTVASESVAPGDYLLVMSNGGFEGIHQRLLERLAEKEVGR